mgnify:FL=1
MQLRLGVPDVEIAISLGIARSTLFTRESDGAKSGVTVADLLTKQMCLKELYVRD